MGSLRVSVVVFAAVIFNAPVIFAADSSATDPQVSEKALHAAVRFERWCDEGDYYSIGHGTAFGIDLTSYGIQSHRYMLSAAHLVFRNGEMRGDLRVELGKAKSWAKCRVVAV